MATAVQVESIWNGLTDNSGQPLAAGKVYTYAAGTTTPVSLYTASDKTSSATNPLILDGNGKAQVWADGRYKFVVKSSADVTLYTLDNLLYGFDDTTVLLGGISTGSANAQVVSVPATVESYANGQRITFIAGYTNSGAVTLQFNSLSPISVVKGPLSSSLQHGDLIAGQLYSCTYYGGSFRLENVPTPADVQRSRAQLIASIAGINTITGTLTPALTGYETGEVFRFKAANANSSAATINIDGLGAKTIQYNNAALVGGEIAANVWHEIVYDGTQFQLLNPVNVSAPLWGGTTAGTSTAYTITPAPAITAYAAGQKFSFKAHAANGATPTLAVSGLAAKAVQFNGAALVSAEIGLNNYHEVVYDGTQFQLLNPVMSATNRALPASVGQVQDGSLLWLGTTAGTLTAFTASASPAITAYTAGQRFTFKAHLANGASATLAVNGLAAKALQRQGTALVGAEFVANDIIEVEYDGTNFQILNLATAPIYLDRTNNRVGVGTTAPQSALSVVTAVNSPTATGCHLGITGTYGYAAIVGSSGSLIDFGDATTLSKGRILYDNATNSFSFNTNAAERMRLRSDGNIGIGNGGASTTRLEVIGTDSTASNYGLIVRCSTGSHTFYVRNDGLVNTGVQAQSPYNLTIGLGANAFIDATGSLCRATSSLKYKKDVKDATHGLADVLNLRAVTYVGKNDGNVVTGGLIAEEVHSAGLTEFVQYALDGSPDALSYGNMVSLAFKAIQELNAKVEALEARVAALEA